MESDKSRSRHASLDQRRGVVRDTPPKGKTTLPYGGGSQARHLPLLQYQLVNWLVMGYRAGTESFFDDSHPTEIHCMLLPLLHTLLA